MIFQLGTEQTFNVQMWEKDYTKADDFIGEGTINIGK